MKTKHKVLLLGIIAIGYYMFTLSVAEFRGQHSFIAGVQVNCTSCHENAASNLSASAYHSSKSCTFCHSVTFVNNSAHGATTTIACTDSLCHANVTANLTSPYEAHRDLYLKAEDYFTGTYTYGPNEACIFCHTKYRKEITFYHPEYINFTITTNHTSNSSCDSGTVKTFNITRFVVGPQATRPPELFTDTGNLHYFINVTQISCSASPCHKPIQDALTYSIQYRAHISDVEDEGTDVGHATSSYDDSYCKDCHYNTAYAFLYPGFVHADEVHAAEKIKCTSCHSANLSAPFPASNQDNNGTEHGCSTLYYDIEKIPIHYQADVCIACHYRYVHLDTNTDTSACDACHVNSNNTAFNLTVVYYSEYSSDPGYVTISVVNLSGP
jgi:hypothetical protein